ncbi:MAG: hypothetical protein ACOYL4_03450 [Miltoncostaeaceae bacterium]
MLTISVISHLQLPTWAAAPPAVVGDWDAVAWGAAVEGEPEFAASPERVAVR